MKFVVDDDDDSMQSEKTGNFISHSIESNNYITIKIGHKSIRTLLDTGSGCTIMNETWRVNCG